MPYPGDSCALTGIYKCPCGRRHRFEKGSKFTLCPKCRGNVNWILVG